MMDQTYVYLIAHAGIGGELSAPVKVGITRYLEKRIASLQTGNPTKLACVFALLTPSFDLARSLEGTFHRVHANKRLAGEWFDIAPREALSRLSAYLALIVAADLQGDASELRAVLEWTGYTRAVALIETMAGGDQ